MFLRPRRFGKSLFLSTLNYFHNLRYKNRYQELFGHLKIYKEDNIINNSYMVLLLNFSSLDITGIEKFQISMKKLINNGINRFINVYCDIPKIEQILLDNEDSIASFCSLLDFVNNNNHKFYVLIDEYDTQVNQLFSTKNSALNKFLLEHHQEAKEANESMNSTYRRFFSELKAAIDQYPNIRTFITGVTPIALQAYGGTSGFNIQEDVTHSLSFANLCGIDKDDVDRAIGSLNKLNINQKFDLKNLINVNYDGYYFHPEQTEGVINPTLFCYIMNEVKNKLKIPEKLIDENVSISDNVVIVILKNPYSEAVLKKLINHGIYKLNGIIDSKVDCLKLMEDEHSLVQYIYYMGGLTHLKNNVNMLTIPNRIARKEYVQGIMKINHILTTIDSLHDFKVAVNSLVQKHDVKPLCTIITKHKLLHLKLNDVVHSKEQDVKTAFMFALSLGGFEKQVENEFYIKKCKKSIDIFVKEYCIHCEFKNIPTDELNLTTSLDWGVKTAESEKLKTKTKEQLFKLNVTRTFNEETKVLNVKQIWESLLNQTKENKRFIEEEISKKVTSFAVLRVGLYVLIDEKII